MTPPDPLWNVPNLLSLSRLPLAVVLFACVTYQWWAAGLLVFLAAAVTDWLDGWWARRYGPLTPVGRSLDPLTDKVLVCGAFIYLMADPATGVRPWMVAAVVGRELLVTGLRGIVEAAGQSFGADWFGKLKTTLQMAAVAGVLLVRSVTANELWGDAVSALGAAAAAALLYAAVFATVGSGVQYVVKAARLLKAGGRA